MKYNTLTFDQLMTLSSGEIRAIIQQIGNRINELHDLVRQLMSADEREKLSAEWRSIVQIRKTLYARLQEMGEAVFPIPQAA